MISYYIKVIQAGLPCRFILFLMLTNSNFVIYYYCKVEHLRWFPHRSLRHVKSVGCSTFLVFQLHINRFLGSSGTPTPTEFDQSWIWCPNTNFLHFWLTNRIICDILIIEGWFRRDCFAVSSFFLCWQIHFLWYTNNDRERLLGNADFGIPLRVDLVYFYTL